MKEGKDVAKVSIRRQKSKADKYRRISVSYSRAKPSMLRETKLRFLGVTSLLAKTWAGPNPYFIPDCLCLLFVQLELDVDTLSNEVDFLFSPSHVADPLLSRLVGSSSPHGLSGSCVSSSRTDVSVSSSLIV